MVMVFSKNISKAWVFLFILFILIAFPVFSINGMDISKPWHTLQAIAKTSSDTTSIDQDANGRIDAGIIEDTLQDITNNGAETTNAITIGGLTVTGTSTFTGSATFNSDVILNSITNCQTDLITDANGKLTCGNDYDKQSDNELITSISLSFDTQTNYLSLTLHEGTSNSKTASISLASLATIPTLSEVLDAGNDAQGKDINNVGSLKAQELCLNGDCKNSWDDVAGNSISCMYVKKTGSYNVQVFCPQGYVRTGCGHNYYHPTDHDHTHRTYPIDNEGCYVGSDSPTITGYAICCKIS